MFPRIYLYQNRPSNGDWSEVNIKKALLMGAVGALIGKWTGNGTQNTIAMNNAINAGKTLGSKVFLTSAKEAMLHPNSGLVLQTMYNNMAKAISKHTIEGITKVSVGVLSSTFFSNLVSWQ